jgi:hypothetical protein
VTLNLRATGVAVESVAAKYLEAILLITHARGLARPDLLPWRRHPARSIGATAERYCLFCNGVQR